MPIIHLTYKSGNNKGDLHLVWHGNEDDSVTSLLEQSVKAISHLSASYLDPTQLQSNIKE